MTADDMRKFLVGYGAARFINCDVDTALLIARANATPRDDADSHLAARILKTAAVSVAAKERMERPGTKVTVGRVYGSGPFGDYYVDDPIYVLSTRWPSIKTESTYGVDQDPGAQTKLIRGPLRSDTATALPAGGGVMAKTPAAEARRSPFAGDSADAAAAGGAAPGAAPMV
ncbi:MAG TPA: hypothetical protein VF928_12715 [Usitatibacteraceae bacterium]